MHKLPLSPGESYQSVGEDKNSKKSGCCSPEGPIFDFSAQSAELQNLPPYVLSPLNESKMGGKKKKTVANEYL